MNVEHLAWLVLGVWFFGSILGPERGWFRLAADCACWLWRNSLWAYFIREIRGVAQPAADRGWARRSNTDTGLIRPYLAEARDQKRGESDDAKTRAAVETLLAAWQPVEGTPLRWSLEWLARNTDRTHT